MTKKLFLCCTILICSCNGASVSNTESKVNSQTQSIVETSDSTFSTSQEDLNVDVILLAGQSNCEGHSHTNYLFQKSTKEKNELYKKGYENTLIKFSTNNGAYGFDKFINVRAGFGYASDRFGFEVGIADYFYEQNINKKIYLIKYAVGGTNLYSQWKSSSDLSGNNLFTRFITFTYEALAQLEEQGLVPTVKAFCWMQGEADACNNEANNYYENEKKFVSDFNSVMESYAPEDGIKFIDAGISDCATWVNYKVVNKAKKDLADESNGQHIYIDTIAAGLNYKEEPVGNPDLFHYDALEEVRLGHLFAKEIVDNKLV